MTHRICFVQKKKSFSQSVCWFCVLGKCEHLFMGPSFSSVIDSILFSYKTWCLESLRQLCEVPALLASYASFPLHVTTQLDLSSGRTCGSYLVPGTFWCHFGSLSTLQNTGEKILVFCCRQSETKFLKQRTCYRKRAEPSRTVQSQSGFTHYKLSAEVS